MADVELTKIGDVIEGVARAHGLELVHWELKGTGTSRSSAFLRIMIDRPQGITHEDCVAVDRGVSAALEADEEAIPFGYTLEVTSPGLGKALAGQPDFDRHRDRVVRIRTKEPVGDAVSFKGRVERVTPKEITLALDGGEQLTVPYTNIFAANVVQLPKSGRRAETGEETSDE